MEYVKILNQLDISKDRSLAFDTETTGTNPYGDFKRWGYYPARPFAWSFCDSSGNTAYVRWKVDPFTRKVIPSRQSYEDIKSIIEDKSITKIAHNLNFDMKMCTFMGMSFRGNFEDTIIGAHVVTGGSELSYALKEFCKRRMGFSTEDEKDLEESAKESRKDAKRKGWYIASGEHFGSKPWKADYWLADRALCKKYAVGDAERSMLVWLWLKEQLESNEDFRKTYDREKRLFMPVMRMELRGVKVFPEKLKELKKFYASYMKLQRLEAEKDGGRKLNFRSPKQKSEIFYDERKYEPKYFTKKGNPSTNGDSLIYFMERYKDKLAKAILEHNAADHMITGFIHPYEKFMVKEDENTWILHPSFKQTGTKTGRLSGLSLIHI